MEALEKRIEKIEENCPAQVMVCRDNFKTIADQLTSGTVKSGQHDTKIQHLEKCADSIKNDVGQIKSSWNKIMAGLVVACILLAINAMLLFSNGTAIDRLN